MTTSRLSPNCSSFSNISKWPQAIYAREEEITNQQNLHFWKQPFLDSSSFRLVFFVPHPDLWPLEGKENNQLWETACILQLLKCASTLNLPVVFFNSDYCPSSSLQRLEHTHIKKVPTQRGFDDTLRLFFKAWQRQQHNAVFFHPAGALI